MKKLVLLFLILVSFTNINYSQISPKGVKQPIIQGTTVDDVINMVKNNPNLLLNHSEGNEIWIHTLSDDHYMMTFEQTTVGYKHAIETTALLLANNNRIAIDFPDFDNSFLPSYINSIFEYDEVNTAIVVGSGEIKRSWDFYNFRIILLCIKTGYSLSIFPK